MATILLFPINQRRTAERKPPLRPRASAEIIIFPGVRIERGTPVLVSKPSPDAGGKPKRASRRGKSKRPVANARNRLERAE